MVYWKRPGHRKFCLKNSGFVGEENFEFAGLQVIKNTAKCYCQKR